MLTRPANQNLRPGELYEFDAVGFRRAVDEWKKTIKPIVPGPQVKVDDAQFDQDVDELNINGR